MKVMYAIRINGWLLKINYLHRLICWPDLGLTVPSWLVGSSIKSDGPTACEWVIAIECCNYVCYTPLKLASNMQLLWLSLSLFSISIMLCLIHQSLIFSMSWMTGSHLNHQPSLHKLIYLLHHLWLYFCWFHALHNWCIQWTFVWV